MKKLVIAVLATSALVSQASADVRSGFYVGADISANALLAKGKISYSDDYAQDPINGKLSTDMGKFGVGTGVYVGYGLLSNCMYYAGELAYNYNSANIKKSFRFQELDGSSPDVTTGNLKLKNEHHFNFAALIGTKLTASTVMYVRLGGNVSQIKMNANVNFDSNTHAVSKKKTRVSFAPGVGMETSMGKNWMARLEYTYDFGKGVKTSKSYSDDGATEKATIAMKNVNTHSVKLGIAYKI